MGFSPSRTTTSPTVYFQDSRVAVQHPFPIMYYYNVVPRHLSSNSIDLNFLLFWRRRYNEVLTSYNNTVHIVVPALGDPRRKRPPDVYGHVINVPTHLNVKLPAIGGHLPNADADSILLVVHTCYNGQCKQMPRFGGHFNPKSLAARTLSCDPQFAQMSMLFLSRVNACVMNHLIVAVRPFGYICFTTSRRKSHVEEQNDS